MGCADGGKPRSSAARTIATALREQMPDALGELLAGFEVAERLDLRTRPTSFRHEHLQELYAGLVSALMRIVVILFAEERGLMPSTSEPCPEADSLAELHARLHDDRQAHGDALDRRFHAWPHVIARFRQLYPAAPGQPPQVPQMSDGVVLRVLDRLLVVGGEHVPYRSLDVEEIGRMYECLMGFDLVVTQGDALRLTRRAPPRQRANAGRGSLSLQRGDERRKTGAHYTPRALTQPIVAATLRPVLAQLGPAPSPEQILDLKVCDPAMGAGAFLVETCRQLADHLVAAFQRAGRVPALAPDEDPRLHARRLVAQRCLYGVDKNPLAVELARLSLWLMTLAPKRSYAFVEHALQCGDSLVGLRPRQIAALRFDAASDQAATPASSALHDALALAAKIRQQIRAAPEDDATALDARTREAEDALAAARRTGDRMVAAFFAASSDAARRAALARLSADPSPAAPGAAVEPAPFHWELELPEVFQDGRGGFDCIVGNPPFLGGKRISTAFGEPYRDWLAELHPGTSSNADLVAHFFRRAFDLLRPGGTFGLVATNTIAQGDTRAAGLRWICEHGGTIFAAKRRMRWPGEAAVIVSVVHVAKETAVPEALLDGRPVGEISAFLLHVGGHDDPARLDENAGQSFIGCFLRGMGFTFDDTTDEATPLAEMHRLIAKDARNRERILPYVGGEEVNTSPTHGHHRYVIHFSGLDERAIWQWPDLAAIVQAKVRPAREALGESRADRPHKQMWWRFANDRPELYAAARGLPRVLVIPRVSRYLSVVFLRPDRVFSDQLVVLPFSTYARFCLLQSRLHELWARCFASTLGDGLRYNPTDCFETFPLPRGHETSAALEAIGREYYEHRAALLVSRGEGLTKAYNRFHDPKERSPGIARLRELHAAMDAAVLDAYGWSDARPTCDYRVQLDETIQLAWGEDDRDELLARLLTLNRARASEQGPAGARRRGRLKAGRA